MLQKTKAPVIIMMMISFFCSAQKEDFIPKVTPISPGTFHFLKYGEIPVSEYTGIPDISIPIFTIKEGDYQFPLTMTYHAGGVRVAEESNWIGLGWNLDVGNVVQIVNDADDLSLGTMSPGASNIKIKRVLPDYYGSALIDDYPFSTNEFPFRWDYPFTGVSMGDGWPRSTGMSQTAPQHSFVVFTDQCFPLNSVYEKNALFFQSTIGTTDVIDAEPDVFKVNVAGHEFQFIIDATGDTEVGNNNIVVLNKKNYKVEIQTNASAQKTWKITTPDGTQYFFDSLDETKIKGTYGMADGDQVLSVTDNVSTRVWHLVKVITTNNRTIYLNWEKSSIITNLPGFSQKDRYRKVIAPIDFCGGNPCLADAQRSKKIQTNSGGPENGGPGGSWDPNEDGIDNGYTFNVEEGQQVSYLSSITFSNGNIQFNKSARIDNINCLRLDSVSISNTNKKIKKYIFNYDYFVADAAAKSIDQDFPTYYNEYFANIVPTELTHRLKLLSVQREGEPAYEFGYNTVNLPVKTSYATDYWGLYNGKISNVSSIPNPIHIGKATLGDNGNDRNAYIDFAKAGTLIQIKYPTGGTTVFDYELHGFSNSSLTDITTGGGLRVLSVTNLADGKIVTKTNYTYQGGKLMNKLRFTGHYFYQNEEEVYNPWLSPEELVYTCSDTRHPYDADYISGNNFYVSSLLGSGNFVGYDKVTRKKIDTQNGDNGSIVSYFINNEDVGAHNSFSDFTLPSVKLIGPKNGSLLKEQIYDVNGFLTSEKSNSYTHQLSDVYYGVKVGYNSVILWNLGYDSYYNRCNRAYFSQDIFGYYPIYDIETLVTETTIKEYSPGYTLTSVTDYTYFSNNLLAQTTTQNSKGETTTVNVSYSQVPSRNIIDRPSVNDTWVNNSRLYKLKEFADFDGLSLVKAVYEGHDSSPQDEDVKIVFDRYDNIGNVLEFHKGNDFHNAFIWGYNNSLPIASAVNASYDQVAYTSFENPVSNTEGGWSFSGSNRTRVDKTTGSYSFNGTTINRSGFPQGNYVITFFAKKSGSSNGSIAGTVSATVSSSTWQYYSFELTNITDANLTIASALIDDLRIYPVGAHMTTYEHEPGVGVTSSADANNVITHYEYDPYGALRVVRDKDNNITLQSQYHYKGQN
jgi:YD repeat-containing protein